MAKFIVYTTWYHEKGLRPADEMREGMRDNVKPLSPAEDIFWWKMDDNHHQSITIYSSEDVAKKHRACLLYTSPSPRDRQKSRMPSSA